MQAGRELDALVAEKVMGLEVRGGFIIRENRRSGIPSYSRKIEYAWEVVEKMLEQGYNFRIEKIYEVYQCLFDKAICQWNEGGAYAETAPLAICLAALKTVGVEVNA